MTPPSTPPTALPPHELELKLVPQSAAAVQAVLDALHAQARVGPETIRRQRDQYLDTPSGQLAGLGLAVRVRSRGERRVMTAKVVPVVPRALADRAEWNAPVEAGADWNKALAALLAELPLPPLDGPLLPFLHLENVRKAHGIQARFEAELCIDHVQVQLGVAPVGQFREIELEFAGGDEAAFRTMAYALGQLPGLEQTGVSKVDRARALAGLDTARYGRPAPAYQAGVPASEAIRDIFLAQWARLESHEGGARLGLDLEHVHKMRVALRRMRSALGSFASVLRRKASKAFAKDLRWIAKALGRVRDIDVQRAAVSTWRGENEAVSSEAWAELDAHLINRWKDVQQSLIETLDSERWQQIKATVDTRIEQLVARKSPEDPAPTIQAAIGAGLGNRLDDFERAAKRARKKPVPTRLHELRIEAKRVRYAIEFAMPLDPARLKRSRKRLAVLQEELGDFQDAVVARDMMKEIEGAAGEAVHAASVVRAREGELALKTVLESLGLRAFLEEVRAVIAPWLAQGTKSAPDKVPTPPAHEPST